MTSLASSSHPDREPLADRSPGTTVSDGPAHLARARAEPPPRALGRLGHATGQGHPLVSCGGAKPLRPRLLLEPQLAARCSRKTPAGPVGLDRSRVLLVPAVRQHRSCVRSLSTKRALVSSPGARVLG